MKELLDKSEEFKKKGLLLTAEDLFQWLMVRDEMLNFSGNLRQEYTLGKLEMDKEKAKKTIELKMVKDEKGKGLTEKSIESLIKDEFYEKEIELLTKKASYELLYERAESIIDFINIVKINMKALPAIPYE